MASIAMPTPTASPLDAISKALQVAHSVYGIKSDMATIDKAKQEQELTAAKGTREQTEFDQKQAATAKSLDPTSQESKLARADAQSFLATIANSELGKKNPQAFEPLVALAKDENTNAATLQSSFEKSPLLKNITALANKSEGAALAGAIWGNRQELQVERQDQSAHQRTLAALKRDPQLSKRVANYQNLENAMSNITQADSLTPQQINEFQQVVRGSLGVGAGGVGEREESYIKSLGLNAENFKQFLTGDPAQISKDSKLVEHFKNLAKIEQKNIGTQMDRRIGAVTAGNKSMYDRRPDLKADLLDAIDATKQQYTADQPSESAAAGGGIPGIGSAQAAPNPKPNAGASDPLAALRDKAAAEMARRKAAKK